MLDKKSSKGLDKNDLFDQLLDSIGKRFRPQLIDSSEDIESFLLELKENIKQYEQSGEMPTFSEEDIRRAKETIARAKKPGATVVDQILAELAEGVLWEAP